MGADIGTGVGTNMDISAYKKYLEHVNRGLNNLCNSSIAVCSLVRDSETNLLKFFDFLDSLRCIVGDDWFTPIFFENDSTDNTLDHTLAYCASVDGVVLSKQLNKPPLPANDSAERAEHMAYCRNQYLGYVKKHNEFDYLIVADSDIQGWDMNGIFSSFAYPDWDVMTANGLDVYGDKLIYYDIWSHVEENRVHMHALKEAYGRFEEPVRVQSGFGGLAIYKMSSIIQSSYGVKRIQGRYGSEHVGLHFDMAEKGFDKIYVNPAMITLRLDKNTLKCNSPEMQEALK